jgi:hypothetical protein
MRYWEDMSRDQLGRYAEYLSRLIFARSGMDIYLPEIDNKGIDFIIRTARGTFFEIQCKARRQLKYSFIEKSKFPLSPTRYLSLALFLNNQTEEPEVYLIPSTVWASPNSLFVDRRYEGKKSKPEWGLQFAQKNMRLLSPYLVESKIVENEGVLVPARTT